MYGKKLREIRTKLKLSQEEISTETKTTYRAYTSYERGDRKPSFEFLEQLALKFNVNLNWLIANKGAPFEEASAPLFEEFKKEVLDEVKEVLKQKGL